MENMEISPVMKKLWAFIGRANGLAANAFKSRAILCGQAAYFLAMFASLRILLALRVLLRKAPRRVILLLWALVAVRLLCPAQLTWRASLVPSQETVAQTAQTSRASPGDSSARSVGISVRGYIRLVLGSASTTSPRS